MLIRPKRLIKIFILLIAIYAICFCIYQQAENININASRIHCRSLYKRQCINLFKRLHARDFLKMKENNQTITRQRFKQIPVELLDEFTQFGEMPVRKYAYVNEAYDESNMYFNTMQVI